MELGMKWYPMDFPFTGFLKVVCLSPLRGRGVKDLIQLSGKTPIVMLSDLWSYAQVFKNNDQYTVIPLEVIIIR